MQSFSEDRIPQPGFDGLGDDKIDPASEEIFQIGFEIHVGVERFSLELDDEVEIALLVGCTASGRTEQPEPPDPKPSDGLGIVLQQRQDL